MSDHPPRLIEWTLVKRLPRWYAVGGGWVLGAAVVGYLFVDRPVEMLVRYQLPEAWFDFADKLTKLGLGWPYLVALAVGVVAAALVRRHAIAAKLFMFFAAVAAAGITVNVLKVVFGRFRPNAYYHRGEYGFDLFSFGYNNSSFPSGHAATAAAVATSLCILLPWGRWVWVALYGAVALSRVAVSAHYLSDVIVGAFVGFCITILVRDACRAFGLLPADRPLRYTFAGSTVRLTCRTRDDDPQA